MTKKSDELGAKLESIESAAREFIGRLESELELATGQRLAEQYVNDLRTQIEQARKVYDGLMAPVRDELAAARAEEELEYKSSIAQIEKNAGEVKAQIREDKMKSWIGGGGSLADFDDVFERVLYPQEMIKRAAQQEADPDTDQAKRAGRNLVQNSFDRF
jgi:hypothetical protein